MKKEIKIQKPEVLKSETTKHAGLLTAGALLATAGVKVLKSKEAKKLYTKVTAIALDTKDCVMKTVTSIQENAQDIIAEAKQINENKEVEEVVEDQA